MYFHPCLPFFSHRNGRLKLINKSKVAKWEKLERNMSLRLKRNLPTIILLIIFLSFLAFAIGNLRIASYSLRFLTVQSANDTTMRFDNGGDHVSLINLPFVQLSQSKRMSQYGEELFSSSVDVSRIYPAYLMYVNNV